MEPEDRELRSALQRLFPPVQEVPAAGTVTKGGDALRLRHRLEKAGVAVLIVALVAGAVAGVSWLTRDLPTRTTNPAPLVTEPAPGTPETYEPLTALPTFSLQDMREIDVSGFGAAYTVLTPEANAVSVDAILAAYAEVTLSPATDGGYTFPERAPDVTMALVPKTGEPLYIGMHVEMSLVSLEVWTAGTSGVARRAWVSGDALHSRFRDFFWLANRYFSNYVPTREDIYLVGISRPGWDRKLRPGQDDAEIDAVFAAYDDATVLPPPETFHLTEGPPAMEITLTFSNQSAVIIRLYQEASSDVMEVWTGGDAASGTASRARIGGEALLALLRHYVELADEQSGAAQGDAADSTTATPVLVLPAAPPAAELEYVAILMKEVGIQNPEVTSRVIGSDANPTRCYDLAWTVADEEAYIMTRDRILRALAMAKAKGEFSLGWYQLRLVLNGTTTRSESNPIPFYNAPLWGADPTSTLEETRSALLPQVENLAADYRLTPVDATVVVDQATQVLSVRVTMARDGDTQNLTKFAMQLKALVNVLNRFEQGGPLRVGVWFLRVNDPQGAMLVVEVHDFITGDGMVKAEINYPDGG